MSHGPQSTPTKSASSESVSCQRKQLLTSARVVNLLPSLKWQLALQENEQDSSASYWRSYFFHFRVCWNSHRGSLDMKEMLLFFSVWMRSGAGQFWLAAFSSSVHFSLKEANLIYPNAAKRNLMEANYCWCLWWKKDSIRLGWKKCAKPKSDFETHLATVKTFHPRRKTKTEKRA